MTFTFDVLESEVQVEGVCGHLKRILIYNDHLMFSGHEVMGIELIKTLLESDVYAVSIICSRYNQQFIQACEILSRKYPQRCVVVPIDYFTRSFQGLRNHCQKKIFQQIETLVRGLQPDLALVFQNDIEVSSLGICVARRIGLPVVSYLALPHTCQDRHLSMGWVRDWTNQYLYGLADRYWVVHSGMIERLQRLIPSKKIDILVNGITLSQCVPYNRIEARRQLNLPEQSHVLGLIGRIDVHQKGHLFCLQMLEKYWEFLAGYHLCIVGSGQDEHLLLKTLYKSSWRDHFTWIPWMEPLGMVYSALDILLLPSRYEGFPLVMLEALYQEIPIVGTRCEAMVDLLPDDWLFSYGDIDGFFKTLMYCVEHECIEKSLMLRQSVQKNYTIHVFKQRVLELLRHALIFS